MTSMRRRRIKVNRHAEVLLKQRSASSFEDELREWDEMPPVGREFGSPDFDRLMDEDFRHQKGVFDPALHDAIMRRVGFLKGKLVVPTGFDEPLPDDVLADFEGGPGEE